MITWNIAILVVISSLVVVSTGGTSESSGSSDKLTPMNVDLSSNSDINLMAKTGMIRKLTRTDPNTQENEIISNLGEENEVTSWREEDELEQSGDEPGGGGGQDTDTDDSVFGNTNESFMEFLERRINELKKLNQASFDKAMSQCPYSPSSQVTPEPNPSATDARNQIEKRYRIDSF